MILRKIIIAYFLLIFSVHSNEGKADLIEIYKNLRCLVCQGQSVADSNSDFASTIKLVVQDQISEGKTKEEIYDFGYEEYIYSSSFCFIEWSERLLDLLPSNYIKIQMFLVDNKRTIKVKKITHD